MSQIKDFPVRETPNVDDFLYLVTQGGTDYQILIRQLLGETNKAVINSSYELTSADRFKTIRMTFVNPKELTVPVETGLGFVEGTVIWVRNASPSNINILPATSAVDLNTKSGLIILPYGEVKFSYQGNDTWDLIGDLSE